MCAALQDKNILVQRTILDVINILFPFHASFLLPSDLTAIVAVALETLLKRDASLSRRFYSWLLGPNSSSSSATIPSVPIIPHSESNTSSQAKKANLKKSDGVCRMSEAHMCLPLSESDSLSESSGYFVKYSKTYLLRAIHRVLDEAAMRVSERGHLEGISLAFKVDCVFPYRVLRALADRPEVSCLVLGDVMLDLVWCLKIQLEGLSRDSGGGGGASGRTGKATDSRTQPAPGPQQKKSASGKRGSVKAEVVQSANLLFVSMNQDFVWQWMESLLEKQAAAQADSEDKDEVIGGAPGPPKPRKTRDSVREEVTKTTEGLEEEDQDVRTVSVSSGMLPRDELVGGHHQEVRAMSPISEMLESQRTGRRTRNNKHSTRHSQTSFVATESNRKRSNFNRLFRQPGLTGVIPVISLLLEILPKVCNTGDGVIH